MLKKTNQQSDAEVTTPPLQTPSASAYTRSRQEEEIVKAELGRRKTDMVVNSLLASWELNNLSIRSIRRWRIFMLAIVAAMGLKFYSDVHSIQVAVLFVASLSIIAFTMQLSVGMMLKQRIIALEKLVDTTDIRVAGAIIEASDYSDEATRSLATSALCKLLPRFRQSDETLIGPSHRRILNDALKQATRRTADLELKCAILKAYEQVGDESAIPIVTKLAENKTPRCKSVREAALACLPFLQERAGHSQLSRELLRAGTAEAETTDALLRPARSSVVEQPDELLRPPTMG